MFEKMGMAGVVQPFCATKEGLRCSVIVNASSEAPSPPPAALPQSTNVKIAWCITGNLRSFFAPLVHESIYRNASMALGGRPSAFFSAATEDEVKHNMVALHGGVSATPSTPSSCATRFANLTAFLLLGCYRELHVAVQLVL